MAIGLLGWGDERVMKIEKMEDDEPKPVGVASKAVALFILALAMVASFFGGASQAKTQSEQLGRAFGPVLLCLIVIGIFSLGKRFRTEAARWKIVFYVSLISLIVQVLEFFKTVGPR
jgi:predicted membrane protein